MAKYMNSYGSVNFSQESEFANSQNFAWAEFSWVVEKHRRYVQSANIRPGEILRIGKFVHPGEIPRILIFHVFGKFPPGEILKIGYSSARAKYPPGRNY